MIIPFLKRLFSSSTGKLRYVLNKNGISPDIILPGNIVIDTRKQVLFHSPTQKSLRQGDILFASIANSGEAGFMDRFVLQIRTRNAIGLPQEWQIGCDAEEADQVAIIVDDFLAGTLSQPVRPPLPANIVARTQTLFKAG